jgi:predicted RNase H-like nuclease (RuvC/YqgF family)
MKRKKYSNLEQYEHEIAMLNSIINMLKNSLEDIEKSLYHAPQSAWVDMVINKCIEAKKK